MEELKLKAKKQELERVLAFIDEELESHNCSMKSQLQLDIAVEELFVNIASYAYGDEEGDATIRIEFFDETSDVEITFIDSGTPYDPLAKDDPDITLSAEERQIGGLGIYMVKKSMDDMRYEYKDNQNIVVIRKSLED